MSVLTGTIQLRKDTEANWTSSNPVLLNGEVAISQDILYVQTNQPRFKIGNGVDNWQGLNYQPVDTQLTALVVNGTGTDLERTDYKVVKVTSAQGQRLQVNLAEEKKALGPNADARINGMVKWASGLVNKGIWGKDDFEEFKYMGGTAKGIAALEKLRASYEGRVPLESAPVEGALSKEELYAMVGDPKYQTDPGFRKKVERMFEANFGSQ